MWCDEEMEPMDTSDPPWCWYYLGECLRWHRFEVDTDTFTSEDIERCYLRDSKAVLTRFSSDCQSKIDFSAMLQTDLKTGKQRRIQRGFNLERSCSCFNAAPVFWETVDPSLPYQLVPLQEVSPEYQTVEGYVKTDGLLDRTIVRIYRIQNLDLWEFYCRKKKQLMRIKGVQHIPERRLFHGTKVQYVENICKCNFDTRLAGRHGHLFGKGVYFARHASYADKYSDSSTNPLPQFGRTTHGVQTKIMFLALVIIGKSTVGRPDFTKPDHGCSENLHDSCVDDIDNPKRFVVFDSNQIYPEYLIQYK